MNQASTDIAAALSQALIDLDAQTPDDGYNFSPVELSETPSNVAVPENVPVTVMSSP